MLEIARMLDLDVVGVSFHVGSGCRDPPVFRTAIMTARNIFEFAASLGYELNVVDIGGGFPGNKGTSLEKVDFFLKNYNLINFFFRSQML